MKKIPWVQMAILCLIAFTGYVAYASFNTRFMKVSIDYLSFLVSIFLVTEGLYKIYRAKPPAFGDQLTRGIRVLIGLWIFTEHLVQFMQYRVFSSRFPEILINYRDYVASLSGIFLIVEGFYAISGSKAPLFPEQFLRIIRIIIGAAILAIHLAQFAWCGTLWS